MSGTEGPKRGRKKGDTQQPDVEDASAAPAEDVASLPPPESSPPVANPWHPINQEAPQRRSASIEDIFRRPGNGGGSRPASKSLIGLALVGLISAWLLASSIHVLTKTERGIVTTFGRYAGTIGPGLNFTLPWPVQAVTRRDVGKEMITRLPESESETLMLTRDGELIDLRLLVRWRVSDLREYTFAFANGEATVRKLADSAMRAAVAELSFDDLRGGKRRAELQQQVSQRLQQQLGALRAGVTINGIEVTETNPPARLADTFRKINVANDDARKNHDVALAYARQVKITADAEAMAFDKAYQLYKIAPDVTRARIYYETMEKILRNNPVQLGGSGTSPAPPGPAKASSDPVAAPGGQ